MMVVVGVCWCNVWWCWCNVWWCWCNVWWWWRRGLADSRGVLCVGAGVCLPADEEEETREASKKEEK